MDITQAELPLRPLQFRAYRDSDFDSCIAIWRVCEGKFFPSGYEPVFAQSLREHQSYYLLGELGNELVACGGVAYCGSRDSAWLTFGMVHPRHHRQGFGTTLLFARLALLEPPPYGCAVAMEVTPQSFGFYRRFGFEGYEIHTDERSNRFASFNRVIFPADAEQYFEQLVHAGASLPADYELPIQAA